MKARTVKIAAAILAATLLTVNPVLAGGSKQPPPQEQVGTTSEASWYEQLMAWMGL